VRRISRSGANSVSPNPSSSDPCSGVDMRPSVPLIEHMC
jgi:hypothetical protein